MIRNMSGKFPNRTKNANMVKSVFYSWILPIAFEGAGDIIGCFESSARVA
jgi:hypothetical protein